MLIARVRALPRLVVVLVLAFADSERRGMLSAVEMFRGFAIEVAYRWPTGHVIADADHKSVILWSSQATARGPRLGGVLRRMTAVVVAVATGLVLFLAGNVLLLVPVSLLLRYLGVSLMDRADVRVAMIAVRLILTGRRAVLACRHDARLSSCAPPAQRTRWQLDHLASLGSGRGGALLAAWLRTADQAGAEVVLHCPRDLEDFYRRYEFHTCPPSPLGQAVMLRQPNARRSVELQQIPRQVRRRYEGRAPSLARPPG